MILSIRISGKLESDVTPRASGAPSWTERRNIVYIPGLNRGVEFDDRLDAARFMQALHSFWAKARQREPSGDPDRHLPPSSSSRAAVLSSSLGMSAFTTGMMRPSGALPCS